MGAKGERDEEDELDLEAQDEDAEALPAMGPAPTTGHPDQLQARAISSSARYTVRCMDLGSVVGFRESRVCLGSTHPHH